MNAVALSGKLADTPTSGESKNGKPYSRFTLRVIDGFRPGTEYEFSCIAFSKSSETVSGLPAGTVVGVSGKLQSRKWTPKDGKEQTVVEVFVNEAEVLVRAASAGGREEPEDDDPWGDQSTTVG